MNSISQTMILALAAVTLFGTLAVAQTDHEVNLARIAGTWSLNLEKTREVLDGDEFEKFEANFERASAELESREFKMSFTKDGEFAIVMGRMDLPKGLTFEMGPIEGEENQFSIAVTGGPQLNATIDFIDKDTLKFMPEGEPGAVLVREVKVYSVDEFTKLLEGDWVAAENEARGVIFKEGGKAITRDEGDVDPESSFTVTAGEEENQFVITFSFNGAGGIKFSTTVVDADTILLAPDGSAAVKFKRVKE